MLSLPDLSHKLDEVEETVSSLRRDFSALSEARKNSDSLLEDMSEKIDHLVVASTKIQTNWETAISLLKASPLIVAFFSAIVGGILWLVKHA